jgi:hypothetical protein
MNGHTRTSNGHSTAQDLIGRIQASVEQRAHRDDYPNAHNPGVDEAVQSGADRGTLESLTLVIEQLQRLQSRLDFLEIWAGQETEDQAQLHHELQSRVADLEGRVGLSAGNAESVAAPRWPDGHFYSPVVDPNEVLQDQGRIWPTTPHALGIDFNHERQREFITSEFARYMRDYDYPEEPVRGEEETRFYSNNPMFGLLDSRALFVLLRSLRPKRVIEVGSGFSSSLTIDVRRRFLDGSLELTCIEPYPTQLLLNCRASLKDLMQRRVQDVPVSVFDQLEPGDVLFVDSSHVAKPGSDVNHLVFEVLPRLKNGVVIHFHDVPLPYEYPKEWVLGERRNWNELYVIRALLMFTDGFEVLFGSSYAMRHFWDILEPIVGSRAIGGGSIWLRKTRDRLGT